MAAELQRLAPDLANPLRWTLTILVSLALAFVTLAVVELPALSSRRRPATRAAVVRPAGPAPLARAS